MKKSLLATASAVALLAGAGLASAQKNEAPTPAPAQQQNAPAEKVAPAMNSAPAKGAETNMPHAKPQTTGQGEPNMEPKGKANAEQLPAKKNAQAPASPAAKDGAKNGAKEGARNGAKEGARNGASDKADVKASDSKRDAKPGAAQAPAQQNQQTPGKAATPETSANLSAEQRTKISAAVRQQNVRRATNVNFSISVGTHVPRSLRLHALPVSVVEFYPGWRGYQFILVGNDILVINPRTLEIVAILEA
jgi:Protein of unknown function (DUF1236)